MRLLQLDGDGNPSLTEFFEDHIPEYAILSHRWGAEEVTFKILTDGTSKVKAGYRKIQFCGEQARRDKLQYFWVDTCCIDKSSSTELAEAINSMFRWYQKAARCYVYLSDVSKIKLETSNTSTECTWESAFLASEWFTRGWTLQELLAPRSVEFFSQEGNRIGNKRTLEQQIHEITGIPVTALRENPLSQFDVDERFSWAKSRQTTRGEDKAYSLFGIFDVQMPLLYGEGEAKAFQRLQEAIDKPFKSLEKDLLRHLPYADEAPFNSYNRQHEPTCLPDTRVDLLQRIYDWADVADGQDKRYTFWLNGLAGTGKSTISRTVAHRYDEQKRLGASFFFSKGGGDASHAGKFFTSLAVQLACNVPSLRQCIREAAINRSDFASLSLSEQWRQLVLSPLSKLQTEPFHCYIIVVDALDECEDDRDVQTILKLLAEARPLTRVRLRIFLTSRPEIPIRHGICAIPQAEHQDFVLHNIQPRIVNHDISLFLEHNLEEIRQEWTLEADWPGEVIFRQLVLQACGLFIWAATACRFIREGRRFARKRLDKILRGSSSAITAPEKHLDEIYLAVLKHSISSDYSDEEKEEACDMLKSTLGSVVVLLSPLSASSLSRLLRRPKEEVNQTFEDLHAILDIPEDPTYPLRLHHPSFRNFLLCQDRCGGFWVDEKQAHHILATDCVQLMSQTLKKDICELQAPGFQASQVESGRVHKCIPPEVQYACLYWVQHLQRSGSQAFDGKEVHRFLQTHLLHWLEALGWMGKTSQGIQAILSLEAHVLITKSPNLYAFIHDAKRFTLYNRSVIEQAPLQLYCSALIFTPERSIVRKTFEKYIPTWIEKKPRVQAYWSAVLQTLEGHTGCVNLVAFSPDGKQVASGSFDSTVRLWDAATGAGLQTLVGHEDRVYSVAFSPDGKQVASGSGDSTVRLWDAATGAGLQTLAGHEDGVYSVAFSPDGKQVASGSGDRKVRLWDAATGAALQMLEGHTDQVYSVAFSPDGKQVASGSHDMTVRLWDAATGAALQTLKGHRKSVTSVAFSPDGKQVASGSHDMSVRLWDAATGAALQTLEGHEDSVNLVAFSPDGKQVASGSRDRRVRLWDALTGAGLQTLKGHRKSVTSVAFSPDGKQVASGSVDMTVRLWDAATGAALQMLEGHTDGVYSVAFSPDGMQVASGSGDRKVRLWDAATGAGLQTLVGHEDRVYSVAFSPDGKQVASGSHDMTVRLWDAATGAALQMLEGHTDRVYSVAFSPDGKQVASGSQDKTVRLWDAATGAALQTLEGHEAEVMSVAFSPDGKQVASGSDDRKVRLWDAATGAALQMLEGHTGCVNLVAFSPDGKQVASGSGDSTVRLWDAATGAALQTLEGHMAYVCSVAFSPDGKQVASGSGDRKVRLWDAATGAALQMLEGHTDRVYSVAFSPDGMQVASGSGDSTVRLWDAATGAALQTLKGHMAYVCSVAFSPDGKQVASGSGDRTVRLWDAAIRTALQTLEGHTATVHSVAFSPDGKQVASGSGDKTVRLWDAVTGAMLQMLEGHWRLIHSVAFSPDGKQVASGSGDKTVRLWDAATGAMLQVLEGHTDWVYSVAFSPDGKQVASGSVDRTVRLWDAATGAMLQTLVGHMLWVNSVAFSPDGKQVASGSQDKTVRLWDAATGAALRTLEGHTGRVYSVAFSPDGKQVASGSGDKTMRLWDAATGAALQMLESHEDSVSSLAFSPDGKLLPILQVSNDWIEEDDMKILWLPPDYPKTCSVTRNRSLVIGHSSGKISLFHFEKEAKLVI